MAHSLETLKRQLDGDLDDSRLARMLYAQDASIYQEEPLAVTRPGSDQDLSRIARFARAEGLSLTPRAGGTSLAGQCVGNGIVIDVSRYLTDILHIDPEARLATVQPGVIQDDLNDRLAEHGLMFAPDTSTSRQAMIGGMIGNNSCGSYSPLYGSTRDHIERIHAVLSDGSTAVFEPLDDRTLEHKKGLTTLEGDIYRTVCGILDRHRDVIVSAYPKPDVTRRNMGYALDLLARRRPWNPDGPPFSLAPLICGSEGTLCLTASAELRLVPRPATRGMMAAHFESVDEACRATVAILEHGPAAVELIDGIILEATKHNTEQSRNRSWVIGNPAAVLAVEFHDDNAEAVHRRLEACAADLRAKGMGRDLPILDTAEIPRVWALRKAGLGLITGIPGDHKPLPSIEDAAVAPADLPAFMKAVEQLMERHGIRCVYYGHASVGLIHFRPMINLKEPAELDRFETVLNETAEIVKQFGGSLSGEHGDGRLRGPLIRHMLSSQVFDLLTDVKRAFDPKHVLNPQTMLYAPKLTTHLRVQTGQPTPEVPTYFDWTRTEGLVRAAEACNGAGFCRQSAGRGAMCPSYMATGEEAYSTRGRANVYRRLLTGENPRNTWSDPDLKTVLDTCLSCKGCTSECPSNVDMARLKAEFLQHHMEAHGAPIRSLLFGHFAFFARLAQMAPRLASTVMNRTTVKRVLGIDPRRSIPPFVSRTFLARKQEWEGLQPQETTKGRVLLLPDEFTHYTDPEPGVATAQFLRLAGMDVWTPPEPLCSARALISKGFLKRAQKAFQRMLTHLEPVLDSVDAIVGIEPSALLGLRDEAPDLVEEPFRALARKAVEKALLFEEYVAKLADEDSLPDLPWKPETPPPVLVHGHCHQKALSGTAPILRVLRMIPDVKPELLDSGCCGMAGSFGYEREHYDLSMAVGEMVLFPAIRNRPEAWVCASGTSCRHQILEGAGRHALHTAQVLMQCLNV